MTFGTHSKNTKTDIPQNFISRMSGELHPLQRNTTVLGALESN